MVKNLNIHTFKGKIILLTGGLGFVGVNLASFLLSHGIRPVILDYIPNNVYPDDHFIPFALNDLDFHNINLTDRNAVQEIVRNVCPDYVIHLASMTDLTKDFNSAFLSVEINIKGTLNLLESIKKYPVSTFVFLSTSDVYGGVQPPFREDQAIIPASPYSVSKASAEMYSLMFNKVYDLSVTVLRSFNLFGKFQKENRVIPHIIMRLLNGKEVELTRGEQKREFNYIENLIEAIILSLITPESHGNIINIGTGKSISIRDIALKIAEHFNLIDNLKFGAIPYRSNEILDMYCNPTQAKSILGWEPRISLEEGLKSTILWYQENFG